MTAYYNEIEPYAAQWLRNLIAAGHIAPGDVDTRSIKEVKPDDLRGYTQCHFFAGIGGWSYALRLAGWPDDRPVWTGSCPCQPFSAAGKKAAQSDERHLWPVFSRLIRECDASTIFGEQVEDAVASGWLDDAFCDLEASEYACASAVLPAYSAKTPHERFRIFFVADADGKRLEGRLKKRTGFRVETLPETAIRRDISAPYVCSAADGVSGRVGRLRAYGNAIVPQVAAGFIGAYLDTVAA